MECPWGENNDSFALLNASHIVTANSLQTVSEIALISLHVLLGKRKMRGVRNKRGVMVKFTLISEYSNRQSFLRWISLTSQTIAAVTGWRCHAGIISTI